MKAHLIITLNSICCLCYNNLCFVINNYFLLSLSFFSHSEYIDDINSYGENFIKKNLNILSYICIYYIHVFIILMR